MARHKRPNFVLQMAQQYLDRRMPELHGAPLRLRRLDGPPDAPRYAVSAEVCPVARCPRGYPSAIAEAGQCPVHDCQLRCSVHLLLDRYGGVRQVTRSNVHWR